MRRSRQGEERYLPYLLVLPGLAFYSLFVIVPIAGTLGLSLFRWDGLTAPIWVGVSNFAEVVGDSNVQSAFKLLIAFVAFNSLLPVAIGMLVVGAMTRVRIRGMSIFRLVYFLPYTLALAVVAIGWRWLYAVDGSVNQVVRFLLGPGAVRPLLGDFFWAMPALGVVGAWVTFGFVVTLLLSGAQHVPQDLYDQARVDGAGPVREFLSVTLPGIRYELAVALTMTLIFSLRTFDLPLMATQGGPGYSTTTPSLMMYRDVFANGQVGIGAAIAVLLTISVFAGVAIVFRAVNRE